VQPCESREAPFGRYARTSEGVLFSLPGQKGQNPPFIFTGSRLKSVGRLARSVEIMTHRPTIGSLRSSGTANLGQTTFLSYASANGALGSVVLPRGDAQPCAGLAQKRNEKSL